jgi:PAS domain S-box-containing protein
MTYIPPSSPVEQGSTTTILPEQARLGTLSLEISIALTREETLAGMLSACTNAFVQHLDAAFARIWTLREADNMLVLQASSGLYTHLNGPHGHVPVGSFKIGLIAAEHKPHLTNTVIGDPRVADQDWAKREGLISFAGYPLLIGDRLIGVMGMFARHPFDEATLQTMTTIANGIALGIERLRMQDAIKISQQRLTMAQRVGQIGTFDWNVQTNQIYWTPELEALYGLPPGGFEGTYENWRQRVHPEDREAAEANLDAAVHDGPPYHTEFRVIWPDATIHWLLGKGEIIQYDEQQQPLRMLGVNIDITSRKEDEERLAAMVQNVQEMNSTLEAKVEERTEILRQLNIELQRSNQELQDFAYVASHDLQEPLRKIQAFGNLLEEEYGDVLKGGKSYLNRMRNAATRMRVLIDDLLTFSRVTTQAVPFIQVDLNTVLNEVIDDLATRLQITNGHIEAGSLPIIDADGRQMYQMFQNLLNNALKFHQPGIPPIVNITATIKEDPASEAPQPEQICLITIQDNGIGFEEKYLDRIFTVFQRLHGKNEYEGTGIGLAVVRKIIERHNGSISATSSPGNGATFLVTLPVYQKKMKETDSL